MTHAKVTQYIQDKIRHVEHNSTVHSRIISSLDELKTSGYDFKKDQKQIVQTIIHGTESASIINKLFSLNIDHEHALKLSVEAKNKTAVKALIDKGVNLSYQDPATGKTPLHIAIEKQNPDIVEYILDSKKINFDIRDQNNDTVQNIAFKIDKNNAISKMLKSAILENAIPTGALDRMQDIIEHGADVANVDKKGNNLLHRLAASAGPMNQTSLQKAVDFLPNSGSLLLQANKKGKTPIDIARTSKDAVIKHVIGSSSSGPSR